MTVSLVKGSPRWRRLQADIREHGPAVCHAAHLAHRPPSMFTDIAAQKVAARAHVAFVAGLSAGGR